MVVHSSRVVDEVVVVVAVVLMVVVVLKGDILYTDTSYTEGVVVFVCCLI